MAANVMEWLVLVHWLLMMALTFGQNGPLALKSAVAIMVTMTYLLMHRAWSLFLGRPCKAMTLWGNELQKLADEQASTPVVFGTFQRR